MVLGPELRVDQKIDLEEKMKKNPDLVDLNVLFAIGLGLIELKSAVGP